MAEIMVGDRPFDPDAGPLRSTYQSIFRQEQYGQEQTEYVDRYQVRTAKEALQLQYDIATGKASRLLAVGWNTINTMRTVGGGFTVEVFYQYPPKGEDTLMGGGMGDIEVHTGPNL